MIRTLSAACGVALLGLTLSRTATAQAVPSAVPDGTALVFLGDSRPILFRLHVEVDGQPVLKMWHAYIKKWFDFLDRDGDGRLNAQELRYAPREQMMRQLMQQSPFVGNIVTPVAGTLLMSDLGKRADDTITSDDLIRYYDSKKVSPVQLAGESTAQTRVFAVDGRLVNNAPPSGAVLTEALMKLIDLDKDGKLSREELQQAAANLRKLDSDDDELILSQEIVPSANPTGLRVAPPPLTAKAASSNRMGAFFLPSGQSDAALATLLLAQYDRDKDRLLSRAESGMNQDRFRELDGNADGKLDAAELARWHSRGGDLVFTVRIGGARQSAVEVSKDSDRKLVGALKPSPEGQILSLGDAEVRILRDSSPPIRFGAQNQLQNLFRRVDSQNRGFIEMKDVQANRELQQLVTIFPLIDRDGDGKMTTKELQAFTDLQSAATGTQVSLAVAEHGRNLFQLLDGNGDGRLSPRELLSAWSRLQVRDVDGDGFVDATELARQFQITVERGGNQGIRGRPLGINPETPRPRYGNNIPAWFQRMDRNGDGDVSVREFLGTREEFSRIDTDADGLISADEAERYQTALRKQ